MKDIVKATDVLAAGFLALTIYSGLLSTQMGGKLSVIWLFASYSKTQQNNNVSRKAGVKKLRPFLYPKTN